MNNKLLTLTISVLAIASGKIQAAASGNTKSVIINKSDQQLNQTQTIS